ncbi:MAG: tetratricopeptide repeat protein [Candidatus Lokiarchaeota archaeon]|nr:tetratricopeptide repeat protein [Candidatus Lokiarchaeota archaeon]
MVDIDKLLDEAKELLKNEDFIKAIEILEALYNDNPSEKSKENLIGALFSYGGYLNDDFVLENEKSIDIFRRIIVLEPTNYKAYYNLGISYFNLERFGDALEAYKTAINFNPNYKHVYYNLGLLYESTRDFQKAVEAYRKALEIDPNYIYAMHALNSVRQNLNDEANKDNQSQKKKDAVKQLISLLKVSKRIRIDMIQEILEISKETLIELLIKWGEKFNFEIDGDYINVNREYLDELLEYLNLNGIGI